MTGTHVIICTHTTRHLERTLWGVSCQTDRPASIIVSCDTDDAGIRELVSECSARLTHRMDEGASLTIGLVQRAHQGESRSSQVRNNAVRAGMQLGWMGRSEPTGAGEKFGEASERLWFLDGDCCPVPEAQAMHVSLGRHGGLVVGFRIDLTAEQTEAMSDERMRQGLWPVRPTKEQMAMLRWRHRRYVRAAFLRRLGLAKPHKPKLLSANFSVGLDDYVRVNGFDEAYVGYGQEDDDLGRRLYRAGVKPVIGVGTAVAMHQWHATRAPVAWEDSPNAARFAMEFGARCRLGLDPGAGQAAPIVRVYERGEMVREEALIAGAGVRTRAAGAGVMRG
ncbi:MAG: galactosyltransferase-related protein [Phycisphaerales bacterium]